ncbi:hypothetical protein [Haloplanus salilacus]|uniref:hypothetical protein n=1 Tax=Haloplanus salilacus TaxID=2949994 RepID=UPI0030CDB3AD
MTGSRRRLAVVVGALVVVGLVFGVGGYDAVVSDHGAFVGVAEPTGDAYVAFADDLQCGTGSNGANEAFVRNRFADDITITEVSVRVTATGGSVGIATDTVDRTVEPNSPTDLTFEGSYGTAEGPTLRLTPPAGNVSGADRLTVELVEATGSDVRVSGGTTTYEVDCPDGPSGG